MKGRKFQKLKERIANIFEDESRKKLREMAESDDPLGFRALNNAIDRLIESRGSVEEKSEEKIKKIN